MLCHYPEDLLKIDCILKKIVLKWEFTGHTFNDPQTNQKV